ncbi:hypothetical protein AKUG0406_PHAGE200220 (plasmid) [Apilactobacillus kunkeei]|nr:hypothetical protein AKUG0406_PHAGE200220 [Apilactobacillus kunkeei]CAI2677321.1 hypothetical protein AKUG0403_PHAGE200230 [Apilactobacillus kunkeei]CAI2680606.1 hypothetical protein AKUG0420_PHAGE200230 [Apilactobacillus kunkeei]
MVRLYVNQNDISKALIRTFKRFENISEDNRNKIKQFKHIYYENNNSNIINKSL